MTRTSSPRHLAHGLLAAVTVLAIAGTPSVADADVVTSRAATSTAPGISVQRAGQSAPELTPETLRSLREPRPSRTAKAAKPKKSSKSSKQNTANKPSKSKSAKKSKGTKKPRKSAGASTKKRVTGAAALSVPRGLRRTLGDLYFRRVRNQPKVRRKDVVGPINIRYGRVTQKGGKHRYVFYAIGDTALFGELFDPKLLPHVWRKTGTDGKWKYLGTTPDGVCAKGMVPRRLASVWKIKCSA